MKWLRSIGTRLWGVWMSLQVEFQGSYSVERLHRLDDYSKYASCSRLILVCLLTPMPCLVVSLLNELPPLAPPEAGVYANWVFWIRVWVGTCFINGALILQIGQYTPRLQMETWQIVFSALTAGTISVAVGFAATVFTVFPLPFGMLLVAPPSIIAIMICSAYFWGEQWRSDALLRSDVKRILDVSNCQTLLTWVYPLYIFGFVSFRGTNQVLFILVLPCIRLIGKNWISRILGDHNDMKPEAVIFNVEIFNALYLSSALQNASSVSTTVTIMIVDLLHFWLSMVDVMELLRDIKLMMAKIPRTHAVASESFAQVALRLLAIDSQHEQQSVGLLVKSRSCSSTKVSAAERQPSRVKLLEEQSSNRVSPRRAQVFPIRPPSHKLLVTLKVQEKSTSTKSAKALSLAVVFSRKERLQFVEKTLRVLFVTEYLVLVEYTEAILPIVYSIDRAVLSRLPNCVYYPSLANLTHAQLVSTVTNVLVYGALEFASLLVTLIVLKRTLGFSSWRQLAFVLESQAAMVQTKLVIWFMYIMQISLVHLGTIRFRVQRHMLQKTNSFRAQAPTSASNSRGCTRARENKEEVLLGQTLQSVGEDCNCTPQPVADDLTVGTALQGSHSVNPSQAFERSCPKLLHLQASKPPPHLSYPLPCPKPSVIAGHGNT